MSQLQHPILVISYGDDSRNALTANLLQFEVAAVACATFCDAENLALQGCYSGILVDLPSMIKAKGEEKVVACSLTGFYPTLRVRTVGSFLVPMIMPGGARQDNTLKEFLDTTCAAFSPRTLRTNRRYDVCLSTISHLYGPEQRGFTLNISWGGAFIVDIHPEKYRVGEEIAVFFPELDIDVHVTICWIRLWGQRHIPGIGVKFREVDEALEGALARLLKNDKDKDRDRLVA